MNSVETRRWSGSVKDSSSLHWWGRYSSRTTRDAWRWFSPRSNSTWTRDAHDSLRKFAHYQSLIAITVCNAACSQQYLICAFQLASSLSEWNRTTLSTWSISPLIRPSYKACHHQIGKVWTWRARNAFLAQFKWVNQNGCVMWYLASFSDWSIQRMQSKDFEACAPVHVITVYLNHSRSNFFGLRCRNPENVS